MEYNFTCSGISRMANVQQVTAAHTAAPFSGHEAKKLYIWAGLKQVPMKHDIPHK